MATLVPNGIEMVSTSQVAEHEGLSSERERGVHWRRRCRDANGLAGASRLAPGSDSTASLDAQLGQRARERRVDGRDFFGGKLFVETGFGALPRFFGLGFVDAVGLNREVSEDGDAVGGDFDETLARRDEQITAVLPHDHFARYHLR